MIIFLRFAFSFVVVAMLAVTSWASLQQPIWAIPESVTTHPWFIATLFDAYFGFLTFYCWVAYKERGIVARVGWLLAILILGNIAMAGYMLIQLFRLPTTASWGGPAAAPRDYGMIYLLLVAWAVAAFYFAVVWAISTRVRNYGFLDVAWSYGVAVLAPLYLVFGPGDPLRKGLVASLGILWSLRLGTFILRRVLRHHPEEDRRYQSLRKEWPGPGMFLLFFQLQAVIAVVFSWPFLAVAFDISPNVSMVTWLGIGVAIIAIAGESLADWQMSRFKADAANQGEICQRGLWGYSRHPNYFFEALAWVGFFLCAVSSPWGWISIVCPILISYFLLKVTGIELTEKHSLERHGEKYRQYQRTTSPFIPWFKKKA